MEHRPLRANALQDTEIRLKALMVGGLDGDAKAHARLLSELSRYLRAYFIRRMGNTAADVEDLVQETLLVVHLKRGTYDRAQPFTAWAYALARYKMVDHFRQIRRKATIPLEDAGELFAAGNPEEGFVRADLGKLLARLPARSRVLIEDMKLDGLSVEEAAAKRGVTAVSARVTLHRGLNWLSRAVRDENR
jgi:RNA polymerase sigma-70 factor (ECF subfamily)